MKNRTEPSPLVGVELMMRVPESIFQKLRQYGQELFEQRREGNQKWVTNPAEASVQRLAPYKRDFELRGYLKPINRMPAKKTLLRNALKALEREATVIVRVWLPVERWELVCERAALYGISPELDCLGSICYHAHLISRKKSTNRAKSAPTPFQQFERKLAKEKKPLPRLSRALRKLTPEQFDDVAGLVSQRVFE